MGVTDKMWDGKTTVIKMNDKVERMMDTIKSQQQKIESMNERLIRLEVAFLDLPFHYAGRSGSSVA